MRVFISIDVPEKIKEEIKKIQNQLPDFKGKFTELENLHLTLKFLGNINEEKLEEIKKKLEEINFDSFDTKVDSIGVFDNRNSNSYSRKIIVWLHLTNCEELQEKIDEKLSEIGFEKEKRFMSHLTIARIKYIKDKERFLEKLKEIEIPKRDFKVDNFRLKKSTLTKKGPVYETIGEYSSVN